MIEEALIRYHHQEVLLYLQVSRHDAAVRVDTISQLRPLPAYTPLGLWNAHAMVIYKRGCSPHSLTETNP